VDTAWIALLSIIEPVGCWVVLLINVVVFIMFLLKPFWNLKELFE